MIASPELPARERSAGAEGRLVALDLIRFIAALAVMLLHFTVGFWATHEPLHTPYPLLAGIFKFGYLGVDAFFVVSGFVILMTARNRGPAAFAVSRVTRLYPAYWLCVTVAMLGYGWHGSQPLATYLANMSMLQSFLGFSDLDGVYWTLAVELTFYALILVILLAGQIHRMNEILGAWLISCLVLDAWPAAAAVPALRLALVYEWAHYFIAGALFYLIWKEGVTRYRLLLLGVCYLRALRIAYWKMADAGHVITALDVWILVAVLSLIFLAFMLLAVHRLNLEHRCFTALGNLTYPLYLIHGTVGALLLERLGAASGSITALAVCLLAALVAAHLIHRLVEKPFAPVMRRALLRLSSQPGNAPAGS